MTVTRCLKNMISLPAEVRPDDPLDSLNRYEPNEIDNLEQKIVIFHLNYVFFQSLVRDSDGVCLKLLAELIVRALE